MGNDNIDKLVSIGGNSPKHFNKKYHFNIKTMAFYKAGDKKSLSQISSVHDLESSVTEPLSE
jgi:hypothetical protein